MSNKDGAAKNLDKVKAEVREWFDEEKFNLSRLKYVTLPLMKSRVPMDMQEDGYPDNNEIIHLLTALISTTFHRLPRTLTYLTIIVIVLNIVAGVAYA